MAMHLKGSFDTNLPSYNYEFALLTSIIFYGITKCLNVDLPKVKNQTLKSYQLGKEEKIFPIPKYFQYE